MTPEHSENMLERTQIQKKKKCPLDAEGSIFTFHAWASKHWVSVKQDHGTLNLYEEHITLCHNMRLIEGIPA